MIGHVSRFFLGLHTISRVPVLATGSMDLIALLGVSQLPQGVTTAFYYDQKTTVVHLAYQLGTSFSSSVPTQRLFTTPANIPTSFSVACALRLSAKATGRNWSIFKVAMGRNVSLSFDVHGQSNELVVRTTSHSGQQEVRTAAESLFDGTWHRIVISIRGREVKWIVDCELIGSTRTQYSPLPFAHDSNVHVGVRRSNKGVAVAFYNLSLFCDPFGAEQSQCHTVRTLAV